MSPGSFDAYEDFPVEVSARSKVYTQEQITRIIVEEVPKPPRGSITVYLPWYLDIMTGGVILVIPYLVVDMELNRSRKETVTRRLA